MQRIVISPQARDDIASLVNHFKSNSPRTAKRFVEVITQTVAMIARQPFIGHACTVERYAGLRVRTVGPKFRNFLIYYMPSESETEIMRVVHGAREFPPRLR